MAVAISYILLALLAFTNIRTLFLSPPNVEGRYPLVSCNSVVCGLFFTYIVFSASLPILADDFEFTWVPELSGAENCIAPLGVALFAAVIYAAVYQNVVIYQMDRMRGRYYNNIQQQFVRVEAYPSFVKMAWALVVFGVALKCFVVVKFGGVSASITQMSGGLREALGIEATEASIGVIRSFSTSADFAAAYLLSYSLKVKRYVWRHGALLIAVLLLSYLTAGKRTSLIEYVLIATLAASANSGRPIERKWFFGALLGGLVFGAATLWLRSFYAAEINGVRIDIDSVPWSHGSVLGMYFFSLEYAFFETLALCIKKSDEITTLFGGSIGAFFSTQLEPLLLIIPRAIWPGKPEVLYDLSHGIGAVMFGVSLENVQAGIAPSYIGTSWILGGPVGTLLYSSLIAAMAANADAWFWGRGEQSAPIKIQIYGIFLFATFVLWRQGGFGYSVISLITSQLGHILGLFMLLKSMPTNNRGALK